MGPFKSDENKRLMTLKLRCDERFTHAFTACSCVFKEITLVGLNQGNYFENENACSKRTLKTTVATQLNSSLLQEAFNTTTYHNLSQVFPRYKISVLFLTLKKS